MQHIRLNGRASEETSGLLSKLGLNCSASADNFDHFPTGFSTDSLQSMVALVPGELEA